MPSHPLQPPQGPSAHNLSFRLSPMQSPQHECHRVSFSIPQSKMGLSSIWLHLKFVTDTIAPCGFSVIVPWDPKSFLTCFTFGKDHFPQLTLTFANSFHVFSSNRRLSCFHCSFRHDDGALWWTTGAVRCRCDLNKNLKWVE